MSVLAKLWTVSIDGDERQHRMVSLVPAPPDHTETITSIMFCYFVSVVCVRLSIYSQLGEF